MTNDQRSIRYFPIALFASVMGISGAAIALKQFEQLYELEPSISTVFLIMAVLLFIINGGMLLYRVIAHTEDVATDFNHPVKMNFFGAISISLLLISVLFYDIQQLTSLIIWGIGSILQLGLTLLILTKLMWKSAFQIQQFNPVWFIPIVGNIVVPLAGVFHVGAFINWLFFSIGILFSIIYMTLFMNRMFFHPSLPGQLIPTLFILLAPPSIGFMSYIKLTGKLDVFAYILYGIAFYLGLLFLFQIKRFFSGPFFISWWAFLFPSAAITNATFLMYEKTGEMFFRMLFQLQIIGLVILTLVLIWKTVELVKMKALCKKSG